MQAFHKMSAVFDDPNLIGSAGLVLSAVSVRQAGSPPVVPDHGVVLAQDAVELAVARHRPAGP